MKIDIHKYRLDFRFEAGTSRGVMTSRDSYFIKIYHPEYPEFFGLGECAPLNGLSPDLSGDLQATMAQCIQEISKVNFAESVQFVQSIPEEYPALRFGMETALLDFKNGGKRNLFDNDFTLSKMEIPINGLVWMGEKDLMFQRLKSKIDDGFHCIKIKIGGIRFDEELALLSYIRKHFSSQEIVIRLDANGAFHHKEAPKFLEQLSKFDIHSIEQPIMAGEWQAMEKLCSQSPIPIALDEELIGVFGKKQKIQLLENIKPAYLILKPTLLGGFDHCREWINLAKERGIGWWMTSALESNIGLNAIAQFTAEYNPMLPQGLGTGQLFHNNIPSPLQMNRGFLSYNAEKNWELSSLS